MISFGFCCQFTNNALQFRRHAERTAQLWLQKLRDSPAAKRLNLIYLANGAINPNYCRYTKLMQNIEVAQQSRARRKEDFLIAFSPVSVDCTDIESGGYANTA